MFNIANLAKKILSFFGVKSNSKMFGFLKYSYVLLNPCFEDSVKKNQKLNYKVKEFQNFLNSSNIKKTFIINNDATYLLTSDGLKVNLNIDDSLELGSGQSLETNELPPSKYSNFVENLIIKNMSIAGAYVDVGANNGYYYSMKIAKAIPNGTIYAFEPNHKILPLLRRNIKENNFKNIVVVDKALSDSEGEMNITTDLGASGYIYQGKLKNITDNKILVTTLDKFSNLIHSNVDVIKVDVEGNEYKVFSGAKELLEKYLPLCIFEFNSDVIARNFLNYTIKDYQEFFSNMNYLLFKINDCHDYIAIHESKVTKNMLNFINENNSCLLK